MAEKEYIERGAAVTALLELRKTYRLVQEKCAVAECILQIRDEQPAADVVEVVRCKDCRHFCPYDGEEHKGDCNELVGLESCVYEDDYCSYGEAKMDGKEQSE